MMSNSNFKDFDGVSVDNLNRVNGDRIDVNLQKEVYLTQI
jgi:hypothetical protein